MTGTETSLLACMPFCYRAIPIPKCFQSNGMQSSTLPLKRSSSAAIIALWVLKLHAYAQFNSQSLNPKKKTVVFGAEADLHIGNCSSIATSSSSRDPTEELPQVLHDAHRVRPSGGPQPPVSDAPVRRTPSPMSGGAVTTPRPNGPFRVRHRECARLMGFPDPFKIHPEDGHAYQHFGVRRWD